MTFSLSKGTSNTIKVVAAIMVMLHHYAQYICVNNISDSIFYRALSAQAGFLGVAIFFFLSGFGLMESEQRSHLECIDFFKRRFLKVYLPVLIVSILWMIITPFILNDSPFRGIEIEMVGGGKTLVISNIFVNFGDGVLWFIKVLVFLYFLFFIYSYIRTKNKIGSILFLVLATIGSTISATYILADYTSISVPFFFLGVLLSINKKNQGVILAISLLIVITIVEFASYENQALVKHSAINAFALALLILACSIRKIELRIPSVITVLSFDIYLIHNKVLMAMKANTEIVELLPFIILTIIATIGFYLFRTKLLRIK